MKAHEELFALAKSAEAEAGKFEDANIKNPTLSVLTAAKEVANSFCGSWLGYHSRVYYSNFSLPPPGAHFSAEWGLEELYSDMGSRGNWQEYRGDDVRQEIYRIAGNPSLDAAHNAARSAEKTFDINKSACLSVIETAIASSSDRFLEAIRDQISGLRALSPAHVAGALQPRGQFMSRDAIAISQRIQIPPHVEVLSECQSIQQRFGACKLLSEAAQKAASHLERKEKQKDRNKRVGTNVFIGHGRSPAWRELKDFVQERLRLPADEFNRVPVAGMTNVARLSEMLEAAAVAFVIMTAEDEVAEGKMQARMNVIHEVGLFQGRLGFSRAIVLLEEGCEEFSNIQGLGQIRFPQGCISIAYEEVRRVLEREGLLE